MRYNLLYIVPQTFLVDRRWNFDRNFIVCEVKNKYNYADMAKLADAHGSGPCVSRHASSSLAICTRNEVAVKNCGFFIYTQIERAVPTGPKRHTVQQMISANRNCSGRAIALGKSVAADLLRFADKSAHQVRSCTSVCFITCEFESRYL